MAILGPFSVAYPVAFRSGGDTTKEAFGKHIQEIEKIYGIINALDADKIAASEFTAKFNALSSTVSNVQSTLQSNLNSHINSSNPHPNWKVNLSSQVTGSLPSSSVSGNFDTSRINGLENYCKNLVKEDFVCNGYEDHAEGYVDFNQLQIRFGRVKIEDKGSGDANEQAIRTVNFLKGFTVHPASIVLTIKNPEDDNNKDYWPMLVAQWAGYFTYQLQWRGETSFTIGASELHYIAIGH